MTNLASLTHGAHHILARLKDCFSVDLRAIMAGMEAETLRNALETE
jgi:hypothetical protein